MHRPHPTKSASGGAGAGGDVESLPLRDKLAQLLMVGVRNAGDAKAVVADNHVGGIFITAGPISRC